MSGVTDLATLRPDLAAQWHSSNELRPEQVRPNAAKKVVWQCEEGPEWEDAIYTRSGAGQACPYCSGHRVMPGETDLATLHPELAREWDGSNTFSPQDVTSGSDRRAKWRCAKGHVWDAIISSRTGRRPAGCPCCRGRQAVPGLNDLSTLRPDLAAEWDASNKDSPELVKPSSSRKAIWRCADGHAWEASVASRSKGGGCPLCPPTPTKKISQSDRASLACSEGLGSLRE
ncbi:zinc-ribbon domain-containing protein [Microbacterium sp.]|uniref:zinc-ribbon domain-containing protein n=1 Tax=Microbacterium sp. TaxID=51671 RepID=UPI003A8D7AF6